MTLTPDDDARSPWLTIWLSPRATIERLVASRPSYVVPVLVILGTIASFYQQLVLNSSTRFLSDWRVALGFVLLIAVYGLIWFYFGAWILNWVGRWMGGKATVTEVRAVYGWSMPPVILGGLIVLALGAAMEGNAVLPIVMSLVTVVFSIWSFVIFLLMLSRVEHFGFWRAIGAYLLSLVGVSFALAIAIRTLLFQPFNIPSGAMKPTLLVGDYIFVSKFVYGYSHYSLPFSPPLFSGRIFASEPAPGDVVVFRLPKDTTTDYVKRVVGLPGDRVQMKDGALYINDVAVKRERLADIAAGDACGMSSSVTIKRWRETLPNGASYETLDCIENGFLDNTPLYTVPAGHTFMLGDNRDNSTDSRVPSQVGYVPLENLIGRVSMIFFSKDTGEEGSEPRIREERIGTMVR